jgi:5'-3' exonuclease
MGIPAAFKWLSTKYPKILSPVIEDHPRDVNDVKIPVDATQPNPNGEEFDNLYLDMNGIVHPCSHPDDRPPPANEVEMMLEIFKYTERVFNMVRPRKLLMIAVGSFLGTISLYLQLPVLLTARRWCCSTSQDESATFKTFPIRTRSQREG